ncbi:hypothetical protein C4H11_08540 [Bacteroides zoogleoformans]|uniref:Uncharacterized protein n=1 Tax=Bacteroides zoogleoformans TaxID=28119 RepID=A0ABM6T810_9BACE|nr:hypothetical protein C4H11_08540 [Bacteroides zoogleoformans]
MRHGACRKLHSLLSEGIKRKKENQAEKHESFRSEFCTNSHYLRTIDQRFSIISLLLLQYRSAERAGGTKYKQPLFIQLQNQYL